VRVGVCAAVAFSLLMVSVSAASAQFQTRERYERRASILHPERVSGVWDMLQPDGRAIGNTYTGELSDDGASFAGTYVHDGNGSHPIDIPHPVYPFTFRRGNGASCSDSHVEG
jgi:hypothetical protein